MCVCVCVCVCVTLMTILLVDFTMMIDVQGYKEQYIATQGPLKNTIDDFWWMLWQYKCKVIVMLANLIEMVRRYCLKTIFNIYTVRTKEGNVMFNEGLTTFYLRFYGVRHMVEDHSDSERGNRLPPHGLLFPISSMGFYYMRHPTDRKTHATVFVTPVVKHCLERQIAQWVHHEGSIRRPIAPSANALTTELHLALF